LREDCYRSKTASGRFREIIPIKKTFPSSEHELPAEYEGQSLEAPFFPIGFETWMDDDE